MTEIKNENELLSIQNLSVRFGMTGKVVRAVRNVDLTLARGETIGIVGESGCGKSTIAKAVLGLLPEMKDNIESGKIMFDGKNLLELNNREMRQIRGKRISMIFHNPMTALNPVMRIGNQIVDTILAHEDLSRNEAKKRAMQLLEMVKISDRRFREYPHQFSGGMKQRVVVAIALACGPDLIIADEPTTALDVTIQAEILELIHDLQEQSNTAMMMITHDLGIVAETCNYVAVLYAGQVVEYGTVEQIFEHTLHPYTEGLFRSIPDMKTDVKRLTPIPGTLIDPSQIPEGCAFAARCAYADEACLSGTIEMTSFENGHQCRCRKCREISSDQLKGD